MSTQANDLKTLITARSWLAAGHKIALATVIATWGSAPRRVGSHLVIDDEDNFAGSVSGGCVEGAVISEAARVINSHQPQLLQFSVDEEMAWQVGLSCGGTIKIWLEPVWPDDKDWLDNLIKALARRQPGMRTIDLSSGDSNIYLDDDCKIADNKLINRFKNNVSGIDVINDLEIFTRVYRPDPKLFIIGAVHIAQTLAPVATMTGFAVTIIDPRSAFATGERFSHTQFAKIKVIADWPENVMEFKPDRQCAVAALSHDAKIDDWPLMQALQAECFYIGALGSKKTHAKRYQRLQEHGYNKQSLDTIRAPIGLSIGAANPGEIAIAIMAEIISCWHGRDQ